MGLLLASASPRRAELLNRLGLEFRVVPSEVEEGEPWPPFHDWVRQLSRTKALAVPCGDDDIVLAADTVVIMDNKILGKPGDEQEAREMLKLLSGNIHEVVTGICVIHRPAGLAGERLRIYQDAEITKVSFRRLGIKEIEAYIKSGEPMDKAGAYGIQGLGALLVEKIEGCYYNVVGLPLVKTMLLLRQCGVTILGDR